MLQYEKGAEAERLYKSIRSSVKDCLVISHNSGFPIEVISAIKSYIFFSYHLLELGDNILYERFSPDYEIAHSWLRLSNRKRHNILEHDMLLLQHEWVELQLIMQGQSQRIAHMEANKQFNYGAAVDRYNMLKENGYQRR